MKEISHTPKDRATFDVKEIIDKFRAAENRLNVDEMKEILFPVWPNTNLDPDFESWPDEIKARLYRASGLFLAYWGFHEGVKGQIDRGKDLLSKSTEIFGNLNLNVEESEARAYLAFAYFWGGDSDTAELLLSEVQFQGKLPKLDYLRVCYFQMAALNSKNQHEAVIEFGTNIYKLLNNNTPLKVKVQILNEIGVAYLHYGNYRKASLFFDQCTEPLNELGNLGFLSIHFNNLSFVHLKLTEFTIAHSYIDKAIKLNRERNQDGLLAGNYDTKALIYYESRIHESALKFIDKAIDLFREGDDQRGLVDALFNKTKILIRFNDEASRTNALLNLIEALDKARVHLGEKIAFEKVREILDQIYFKKGLGLSAEMRNFQEELIKIAFAASDKKIGVAAKLLQIAPETLSDFLSNQKDLSGEMGYKKRKAKTAVKKISVKKKVGIPRVRTQEIETYRISPEKLPYLRAKRQFALAVLIYEKELEPGIYYVVYNKKKKEYDAGLLVKEGEKYYLENNLASPTLITRNIEIIGKAFGFCYMKDLGDEPFELLNYT